MRCSLGVETPPLGVPDVHRGRPAVREHRAPRPSGRAGREWRGLVAPSRPPAGAAAQDVRSRAARPDPPPRRDPRGAVPRASALLEPLRARAPQLRLVVRGGTGRRPRLPRSDERRAAAFAEDAPAPRAPPRAALSAA